MEQEINQESIIWIALLYNYIANQETSLSFDDMNSYIKEVSKNLKQMNSKWKISKTEYEEEKLMYLSLHGVEKDENNRKYTLVDMRELEWIYDSKPNDIIHASLQENALSTIYVNKSNLQLTKEYVKKQDSMNIYSLRQKSAIEDAIRILEEKECKNIKINTAYLSGYDGSEPYYYVSYQCEKPIEKVIILKK